MEKESLSVVSWYGCQDKTGVIPTQFHFTNVSILEAPNLIRVPNLNNLLIFRLMCVTGMKWQESEKEIQ